MYVEEIVNEVINRYLDLGWSKIESHDIPDKGKEYTYFKFDF